MSVNDLIPDPANVRVALYLRISEDRTGEEGGVGRQRQDGHGLAKRRGWEKVQEYVDNDLSAFTGRKKRPGYIAMMQAVAAGQVDVIVIYHTSRLWRNRRERADGIELLRQHRVSVIPVRGPELDMTSAYGRGMAGLVGEFDTMESDVKSERQQRKALELAQAGAPSGGRRAFGYAKDGVTLVPDEAAWVREAYTLLLAGRSLSGIAADLTAAGATTTMGNPWRHNSLANMLANPRNAGLRAHRGEILGAATWEALVPEQTWRAAVDLLSDPKRRTNKVGGTRRWLGTNFYLCGREDCGTPVICTYRERYDDGRRRRIYRCPACFMSRLADPVDEFVDYVVTGRLRSGDLASLGDDIAADDLNRLRSEASALRQRRQTVLRLFTEGAIGEHELLAMREDLAGKLADVEQQIAEAGRGDALAALLTAEDPVSEWRKLDAYPDRQQALLVSLLTVELLQPHMGRRRFEAKSVQVRWRARAGRPVEG